MFLTIFNAICLIILGLTGFIKWDSLGADGIPSEMLMPVFFGGAMLICAAFSRQHYRHGLYGGLIITMLGVLSALYKIYQYEGFTSISEPKTQFIAAMAVICTIQFIATCKSVQKDREVAPPV